MVVIPFMKSMNDYTLVHVNKRDGQAVDRETGLLGEEVTSPKGVVMRQVSSTAIVVVKNLDS